jgi:hypothetical protein
MNRDMTIGEFMEATDQVGKPGNLTSPQLAEDILRVRRLCERVLNTRIPQSVGDFMMAYNEVQRLPTCPTRSK